MPDPKNAPAGSEPPPIVTYKNPRRTSPENSITLRHHRLARDASRRYAPAAIPAVPQPTDVQSPRRNSSGDSNETRFSDPNHWFNKLNDNAKGDMDTTAMDIDPPFYQRETDSSNEELAKYGVPSQSPAYRFVQGRTPGVRPGLAHSSSADDYRSVIDDLTVENKRLKEELKKYRQMGPDAMRADKLFEVKVHGLSSRRKRELEAALRDFTTSIDGSSAEATPNRKKTGKSKTSKHASSSSGSNSRPVDSAYASMSTGPSSSVPSLPGQAKAARQRSALNIENYLRDIPEGLWPRAAVMTEKDKKKLVVKRLEHLFTGKMGDPAERVHLPLGPEQVAEDVRMEGVDERAIRSREAQIRPRNALHKENSSRGNGSASHSHSHSNSHSNGDQTDLRDTGNASGSGSRHVGVGGGSGNNTSPHSAMPPPEQRPTRPRDLDPDRQQVPSENMDYIRHLGLVAPESKKQFSSRDVSPDAEGWVYLNLLCNLAQLHILNVTPAFIRHAVSKKSTKFQLSPDGQKIRWRGGVEGTKFTSDSGSTSQRIQSSDETDGSNDQNQRKKQKTHTPGNDVTAQKPSKFGLGVQDSNSSESFHYKPLFVHHQTSSSDEQPSGGDETGSSFGPPEESNLGMNSRWGQSGVSGVSQRKRRRDGAIIYYSGAPFCTDLSGDFGEGNENEGGTSETSPATYDMTSLDQPTLRTQGPVSLGTDRPQFSRSTSGSSLPYRPLSTRTTFDSNVTIEKSDSLDRRGSLMDLDVASDLPELTTSGDTEDDIEADFAWSETSQQSSLLNLEASGLGGVYPDDHFVVAVSTRRPKHLLDEEGNASEDDGETLSALSKLSDRASQDTTNSKAATDSIIRKLATMRTSSPLPTHMSNPVSYAVQIEYVAGRIRRLPPVPLPPPAFYYPTSDSELDDDDDESEDDSSSESLVSRRAIVEEGPSSDVDLSGNDEEDEHSDAYDASGSISPDNIPAANDMIPGQGNDLSDLNKNTTGSSVATAGGAPSGYNTSTEDDM
ncbi:frequency clock protein [Hypoxylon rubiginosum]|uniref:Frequency clock protein n=1 Tax=Hypoxylon rubiginosum TaxID=110542 RepID=A0ACC0CSH3_9PEZI|nr:frequency clock protein [Hypoxylon rubiginosum]